MPALLQFVAADFESFLKWRLTSSILSQLERLSRADRAVVEWLSKVKADVVVVSPGNKAGNQLNAPEAEFIRAAKKIGIPNVIAVLSWDNLTTKGLLPVDTDAVLVWNELHADEARRIHGIPNGRIIVTGSPFFDKWFELGNSASDRHEVCKSLGLSADRPILLYLGSSANIAQNESWLIRALRGALDQDPVLNRTQLVVRPHPANQEIYQELKGLAQVSIVESTVPSSDQAKLRFSSLLQSAFAVVGINTSAFIDAIALDRPCYSLQTDKYTDTHIGADHFRHLVNSNAVVVAPDLETLLKHLAGELRGSFERAAERRRFVERLLRPQGINIEAGAVAAGAIIAIAEGVAVDEINRRLASQQLDLPSDVSPGISSKNG